MLRHRKWVIQLFIIVAVFICLSIGFLSSRKPVTVSYVSGDLIFSPGLFYTIDDYQEDPIYIYDAVLQFDSVSERNYVFRVTQHRGMQYLTIYYHDFIGTTNKVKYQVEFDDRNYFVVVTQEGIGNDFYIFSA